MLTVAEITPEPTEAQRKIIEAAIEQAWPRPAVPIKQTQDKWRFSRRRWYSA